MGKDKKTPITIDGIEYVYEEMTEEQQHVVNHLVDLDRKVSSARFNLEQLLMGKEAYVARLKELLGEKHRAEVGVEHPQTIKDHMKALGLPA